MLFQYKNNSDKC